MPATSMPLNSPVAKISESRKPARAKMKTLPKERQNTPLANARDFYVKNKEMFDALPND